MEAHRSGYPQEVLTHVCDEVVDRSGVQDRTTEGQREVDLIEDRDTGHLRAKAAAHMCKPGELKERSGGRQAGGDGEDEGQR